MGLVGGVEGDRGERLERFRYRVGFAGRQSSSGRVWVNDDDDDFRLE